MNLKQRRAVLYSITGGAVVMTALRGNIDSALVSTVVVGGVAGVVLGLVNREKS